MPNRLKIGLPIYGSIDPVFFQHWLAFQGELARVSKGHNAGLMTTLMPYIDRAENTIVDESLGCTCGHTWSLHLGRGACKYDDRKGVVCTCQSLTAAEAWDYLIFVEHDNIIPAGWIERVINTYTEPIVGLMYFGKVEEDQRPIPGWLRNGEYTRLEYDEVIAMIAKPGLHEVDTVGMGATAIRRDVFEQWNPWMMPWFRTELSPPNQILGQDIYFCMAAKKQGFKVYVDTAFTAEHIGRWRSSLVNYIAANEFSRMRDAQKAAAEAAPPTAPLVGAPLVGATVAQPTTPNVQTLDILLPPLE